MLEPRDRRGSGEESRIRASEYNSGEERRKRATSENVGLEKKRRIKREIERERERKKKGSNLCLNKDGRSAEDITLRREKQRAEETGMRTELGKKVGRGEIQL